MRSSHLKKINFFRFKTSFAIFSITLVLFSGISLQSIKDVQADLSAVMPSAPTPESSSAAFVAYDPNIFVRLSQQVVPSVVNISTTSAPRGPSQGAPNELFRRDFERFFGFQLPPGTSEGSSAHGGRPQNEPPQPQQRLRSLGTGVIIDTEGKKGLILTNHHVIAGADTIQIQFNQSLNSETVTGRVVGQDRDLDLALIEVETNEKLVPLPLGNSDALQVGEFVLAVGNPFGQGHSVSHGIVSAKGRNAPTILGQYIQTDAPINPGNSGGPLVNLKGEVVGINNAILAQAQGIGFAIPSNEIEAVLSQLKDKGRVDRGFIGIQMGEVSREAAAFAGEQVKVGSPFVVDVTPNSPAAKAGIQPNDVILEFNKKPINTPRDLLLAVTAEKVGSSAQLKVLRSGTEKDLKIKIETRPAE
jgi:serine protease Do